MPEQQPVLEVFIRRESLRLALAFNSENVPDVRISSAFMKVRLDNAVFGTVGSQGESSDVESVEAIVQWVDRKEVIHGAKDDFNREFVVKELVYH